jgi:DNA polymerase IV
VRKIIHVDMDAFYASVEQRDTPELRGRPVIVSWSDQPRSVVVAASYEARRFGIHSAMPATRARRLCPEAVFVRPDFERYRAVSRQIREIFLRHTDLVEPLSLDEAYLDVTVEKTGIPTATETAAVIRREIREETGLTASAGVAPNKFLAKIASDWRKPDGLFVIKPHQVDEFLLPLPVKKIPGVGPATERALAEIGASTVADLRRLGEELLTGHLGRYGTRLWELAHGIDDHPVEPSRTRKSYSVETTFATDLTLEEVSRELSELAAGLWEELEAKHLAGRTVTVKLRAANFVTATRQRTATDPPHDAADLQSRAEDLLRRFDFPEATRYRLAGVGVSGFVGEEADDNGAVLFEEE